MQTSGVEATENALNAQELTFNEKLGGGIGYTLSFITDILLTYPIAGSGLTAVTSGSKKIPGVKKVYDAINSTKIGRFALKTTYDGIHAGVAYEMADSDVGFDRGMVEGSVMSVFNQLFMKGPYGRMLVNLYQKNPGLGAAGYHGTRIGLGGTAEMVAEYGGELMANLDDFNGDWEQAWLETIGRTEDEVVERFLLTAVMCYGMSAGFSIMTGNIAEIELNNMKNTGKNYKGEELTPKPCKKLKVL